MNDISEVYCPRCHSTLVLRAIVKVKEGYTLHALCGNARCDTPYLIHLWDSVYRIERAKRNMEIDGSPA